MSSVRSVSRGVHRAIPLRRSDTGLCGAPALVHRTGLSGSCSPALLVCSAPRRLQVAGVVLQMAGWFQRCLVRPPSGDQFVGCALAVPRRRWVIAAVFASACFACGHLCLRSVRPAPPPPTPTIKTGSTCRAQRAMSPSLRHWCKLGLGSRRAFCAHGWARGSRGMPSPKRGWCVYAGDCRLLPDAALRRCLAVDTLVFVLACVGVAKACRLGAVGPPTAGAPPSAGYCRRCAQGVWRSGMTKMRGALVCPSAHDLVVSFGLDLYVCSA